MKFGKVIFAALICFQFFLFFSFEFTAWPEMLFWPYLIGRGWLPYQDIAIAHTPLLVYYLSAFYHFFGVGIQQQKLAAWLVVLISDLIVLSVSKRLVGEKKAYLTLFFYILLQGYYDGNGIWFDHALAPLVFLLYYFLQSRRFLLAGVVFGLAFLTKQTAFYFLIPVMMIRPGRSFYVGSILVIGLFVALLLSFGIFDDFLHWGIGFGIGTLPLSSGQISLPSFRQLIVSLVPAFFVLPLITGKKTSPLFPWALAGMMGALPRFEMFHFQPALPFISLLFSATVSKIKPVTAVALLLLLLFIGRGLARDFGQFDRFNTPADQKIVKTVDSLTDEGDFIFVTGYWDNLYPLTGTLPATRPFVPQLPWYLSRPGVRQGVLSDLSISQPKIIVANLGEMNPISKFIFENYTPLQTINQIAILESNQ